MAFSKYAIKNNFVRVDELGTFYFENMRNGDYRATGEDVKGKRFHHDYVINDSKDHQSPWAMWRDFSGRWGLTRIYFYEHDENNRVTRRLIWSN